MRDGRPEVSGGAARGILLTILGNSAAPIAAVLSAPILASSLGAGGRGEVAGATAPILLALGVATLGIPEAVTYYVARSPRLLDVAIKRGIGLTGLAGSISIIAIILASGLLSGDKEPLRLYILICSAAVLPGLALGVLRGAAAGLHRWRLINREKFALAILRLGGILSLLAFDVLTPLTASLLIAYGPIAAATVYIPLVRGKLEEVGVDENRHQMRLASFGSRVWLGSVAGVLLSRLDQVLMTPLASSEELGLYAVAVSVADVALLVSAASRDVMLTTEASNSCDSRLAASIRITTLCTAGVAVLIAATVSYWIGPLFGRDFELAVPSIWVLLAGAVVGSSGSVAGAALTARGTPQLRSYSLLCAVVLDVAVLISLIPRLGPLGAALATFAALVCFSALNLIFLRRCHFVRIRSCFGVRSADLRAIAFLVRSLLLRR